MHNIRIKKSPLAALFVTLGLVGCGGGDVKTNSDFDAVDTTAPVSDWQLVWSDEFSGSSVNENKWNFEVNCQGGGNQEQQCYTDSTDNAFVTDGTLKIVALPAEEGAEKPYTSARLNSKYKGDFTYGRIEVRAKMPFGQGSWPAVWMFPTDEVYGGWPKSGEIDIVEAVNLKTEDAEGNVESHVYGTLHYGRDAPNNSSSGKAYALPGNANPADDFHTYTIEWQEGEIRWYVDGYLYQTQMASQVRYNSKGEAIGLRHRGWFAEFFNQATGELETVYDAAPFDQRFHLIMNLAVGGTWPENTNNLGVNAEAFANGQTFEIDYVRVYECAQNPNTGRGCETIRAGYKDEETLVEGEAPIPSPPSDGVARNLTIFDGTPNPNWPAWDCCGGSTPEIVSDAEKGDAYKFVVGAAPTVNGFISRAAFITDPNGTPSPFDASPILETGAVSFDMKVVSQPINADSTWLVKVESNEGSTFAELPMSASSEGVSPVAGEWQTFTYPLQMLSDAGLDVSAIDVIMVFPAWGTGEGAEYLLTNVEIAAPEGPSPELVLFGDAENPEWPLWDCCGGTTPGVVADDERGPVAEFSIGATPTVMGFKPVDGSGVQFDASAIQIEGVVQFDMKVVSAPASDSVWKFKIESDGATTAVEVDLATGNAGVAPVTGEWTTYTFPLQTLTDLGLDVSAIDVIMIFPAWGTGDGAVYRVDEARIYNPSAGNDGLTVFENNIVSGWSLWDCCAGSTPQVVDAGAPYGSVAQFEIPGWPETVLGFLADEGVSFDASALLANGAVSFDMRIVTPPSGGATDWFFKVESTGAATAVELPLASGNYDQPPVVGEWARYNFPLQELFDAGLDISDLNVIMVFPAWGTGQGVVYQIDNVEIANF
ncbi:glycoside hydrolase family 16 protein [Pseudidiomarina terrestris]|uniref:Family 16 glycosylhydrolase n=1 Tax=Pseudidiomarina terrestris TaxID=2820060 RepID=A0AAW7QXJ2_9GAMM|nr:MULTISPECIES: glycoside hydrolase family 16 protein [unclassified Pseudidiomarina]MDN7124161.1 family 16 glycosylhydrolase [Pseudidiomarina sp. 1APP75-32.1]MDN7127228.1 family 16 glycosylhydrolase [Pseudidiomarina sp. 1APR75-33.1]MDN7128418.1 family 16 glycosylhydrolase [Pseudidiomarina sp. 1APR75-15]MDN7135334.1 family 16 glycosylhydrolase [Pseudidiomarina sp. 1ASP75-5]